MLLLRGSSRSRGGGPVPTLLPPFAPPTFDPAPDEGGGVGPLEYPDDEGGGGALVVEEEEEDGGPG